MAMFIGPRMISTLSRYQIGQQVRIDGPQSHLQKSGTPTMGGGLDLGVDGDRDPAVGGSVRPVRLDPRRDHARLRRHRLLRRLSEIGGRQFQGSCRHATSTWRSRVAALCAAFEPARHASVDRSEISLYVPFFKTVAVPMSTAGFVAYAYLVIVGTSNAVNLTDGLDGLAIMPAVMVAAALGVFAYATGNFKFATYLQMPYITRRRRGADFLRHHGRIAASGSCGSTPIRRRCSWATWARSPSAPRSAPSR